jgi:hypothetical protein
MLIGSDAMSRRRMRELGLVLAISISCGCTSSSETEGAGVADGAVDGDPGFDGTTSRPDGITPDASDTATSSDSFAGDAPTDRGPAYAAGTAACPAADGTRRVKLVNNCTSSRWFKLDARTTPTWARPTTCPWAGETCTDLEGTAQCNAKAKGKAGGVETGPVYCKASDGGGGTCACNPHFDLAPGKSVELALPATAGFPSGTGWIATGCNALGAACTLGDAAAKNSTFEWTYDLPGKGALYYDISAVNAWTSVSAVGLKSCGGTVDPKDKFHCGGAGCRFDVASQCPDGTPAHPGGPAGCITCPTKIVGGKQVLDGSCGPCPNGASANRIPTGTVFNAGGIGGPEWTWKGSPDFATTFGIDEGVHAMRRYVCSGGACAIASGGKAADTCLGGCDQCTASKGVAPDHPDCLKYCCPDVTRTYGGSDYRYDSAGCTALGVQRGTDYTAALKAICPYVYTYGYEDHSSTFICDTSASLLVQACPDPIDFPSSL